MIITSKQNPKIKTLANLKRRREREEAGVTLVEGFEELSTALQSGAKPVSLYFCPELMNDPAQTKLAEKLENQGVETFELSRDVFEKVAYRESPDGWLAVVPSVNTTLGFDPLSAHPLILVAEAVEKPGNLGAMLRTADAAGVEAVISADGATDWSNPNIVRASKSAIFSVPVAEASSEAVIAWLRAQQVTIVAATPDTDTAHTEVDYTKPVAIVVGTEKHGLTKTWLEAADVLVRIPMAGKVNSLNVATSAAIITYEAVRQRQQRNV